MWITETVIGYRIKSYERIWLNFPEEHRNDKQLSKIL